MPPIIGRILRPVSDRGDNQLRRRLNSSRMPTTMLSAAPEAKGLTAQYPARQQQEGDDQQGGALLFEQFFAQQGRLLRSRFNMTVPISSLGN